MMWLALVIWIIAGSINFFIVRKANEDVNYWKTMYWLTYITLMALIVLNCISELF